FAAEHLTMREVLNRPRIHCASASAPQTPRDPLGEVLRGAEPRTTRERRWRAREPRRPQFRRPWQCLYFLPEPQGQGAFRWTLPQVDGSSGSISACAALLARAGCQGEESSSLISFSPVEASMWVSSRPSKSPSGARGGGRWTT